MSIAAHSLHKINGPFIQESGGERKVGEHRTIDVDRQGRRIHASHSATWEKFIHTKKWDIREFSG
jgi:hypothetical protein